MQVFFLISSCVWPNSGFWCCVFLSLRITLLPSTTNNKTREIKRDLKSELWRKQGPHPHQTTHVTEVAYNVHCCGNINSAPEFGHPCHLCAKDQSPEFDDSTLPIFQESDYALEAASTWLIIILYVQIHVERMYFFIYLFNGKK